MTETFQFELFDDPANRILGSPDYAAFRDRLTRSGCTRCGLAAGRTNIVVDRGSPTARLMVVGEGPGEQEDRQGRAFVGRAGKLLDEIMRAVGLDTERDMLIVNVVKCRPPGNRQPQADEAAACLPFLRKQVALIRPDCILLLGATAARHLLPERKAVAMGEEAGRFFTSPGWPGIDFMLLYHPAFLLRDPRRKKDMWDHVRKFRAWWDERARRLP